LLRCKKRIINNFIESVLGLKESYNMRGIIVFVVLYFFAHNIFAGMPSESGEIEFFQIHKAPNSITSVSQRFFVRLSGSLSESSCNSSGMWFGYLDSDAGKAQYSAILAASISGRSIKFEATDPTSCTSNILLIRNVYTIW